MFTGETITTNHDGEFAGFFEDGRLPVESDWLEVITRVAVSRATDQAVDELEALLADLPRDLYFEIERIVVGASVATADAAVKVATGAREMPATPPSASVTALNEHLGRLMGVDSHQDG
jgi:hypothetical protein